MNCQDCNECGMLGYFGSWKTQMGCKLRNRALNDFQKKDFDYKKEVPTWCPKIDTTK
jgi:hypothetical protein